MRRALAAGLLAATLAACSSAGNGPQLAMTDALMRGASAGRAMALALSPGEIGSGEPLTVEVSHDHAGYLYMYQLATDGERIDLLFPNAVDGANFVAPGTTRLPRASWRLTARGPAGVGYVVSVLTERPQDGEAITRRLRAGRIAADGPYAAAMAMLREH